MDLIKQAKSIKTMSISVIVLALSTLLLIVILFITPFLLPTTDNTQFFIFNLFQLTLNLYVFFCLIMALVIAVAITIIILNIICGIKVLATDWKDNDLNNDKTLWGVLTFVILGGIASLVFSLKATKKLTEQQPLQ